MTSKIVVNNIEADAGVSTVFFNSDIGATGGTLNVDGNLNVDGVITYEDVTSVDSVGIITAQAGIHVTGGVQVATGATITGSTNTIIAETSGEERLRITSAGLVGIGTATPVSSLHVDNSLSGGPLVTFHQLSGSSNADAGLEVETSSTGTYIQRWVNSSSEKVRITGTGYLGIGNTVPRGIVHVGADLISGATDAAAINLKQTGTTAATGIYLERSGERRGYAIYVGGGLDSLNFQRNNAGTKSDVMTMTRDGNIGINETTPDSKLDILHSSSTNAATENLIHLRTDPAANYASRGLFVKVGRDGVYDNSAVHYDVVGSSGNSGTHIFEVQGSEKLRITSAGNIGIGLEDPGTKLEISGGQNQTANQFVDLFRIAANANNDSLDAEMQLNFGISASHTSTANRRARIQAITHAGTARELALNPDGGGVGIGTDDPSGTLHVSTNTGAAYVDLGVGNNNTQYQYVNFGGNATNQHAWQVGRNPSSGGVASSNGFYLYDLKNSATILDINSNTGDHVFKGNLSFDSREVYYKNEYATGSWSSGSWYTVVPHGLTSNCTYLVSLVWDWDGSNGQPYYLATQQLYSTVNGTNGSGSENELTPMCSTHTGGTGARIKCRVLAQSSGSPAMQVNLAFTTAGSSWIRVKVWKMLFANRSS